MENKNNKINVIVPYYNCEKFIERCVNSIMTQKYDNFHVYFIDDASTTEESWNILPHGDKRVTCIKNEENVSALPNIHKIITEYCEPDSICVTVDGDDALLNTKVLEHINSSFNEHDCWIMYGQFMFSTGGVGFASAYTEKEFENIRKAPFRVSHLRSWRAGLYQAIKNQDNDYSCMKKRDGSFYNMAYDVAIFAPLLDMCPYEKVKFNSKPNYLYNFENPISEHIWGQSEQTKTHMEIYSMPNFKKIKDYITGELA